jgi:glycosyltransferase involved in cell wall biosynthesis
MNLFASIIIRSKDRLPELQKLIRLCLAQEYPNFEIVVVDSTDTLNDAEFNEQLGIHDARVLILRTPPRGCAAAANEGVRAARGEVVVFVDDDDLPIGNDWLAKHMRNYQDPACLGVQGAMQYSDEPIPWRHDKYAKEKLLSFGFWKNPLWYYPVPTRKVGIEFLMGGNASLRKEAFERGEGWSDFLPYHNECSLFIRLAKKMKPHEYLVYEPEVQMRIRLDVPGGVGQRIDRDLQRMVETLAKHYLWVVAPAHPLRIYGLFPLFMRFFLSEVAWCCKNLVKERSGSIQQQNEAFRFGLLQGTKSLFRFLGSRGL